MDRLFLTDRTIDLETGEVSTGDHLRPMELRLLKFLASRGGATVTPDELLQGVWRYVAGVRTQTIHSTIYRLRKTIEADPSAPVHLVTVHGGLRLLATERVKPSPTNLIPRRDRFVGRSAELAALAATRARLVSVVGPSGIGKTRLVTEWALGALGRFAGGAWLVDAADARSPEVWMERLASLLRCERDELHAVLAAREGEVLLVLDDVPADRPELADGVRSLLDVSRCTIVITAHAPLGLTGEQRIVLGPLETSAVELLVVRIGEDDHTFDPEAHTEALDALATALDGSPLALELAAPYAAHLGPARALETLRAAGPLASRQVDRPNHHRSTDAMVAHTWSLLPAWARRALQQLAVFERTFSLDLATRLLAHEPGMPAGAEVVSALVARGLVRATGTGRFRLYDLVRSHVGSRGTDPVFTARMIDAYAALAAGMREDGLMSDLPVPSLEELETWEALAVRVLRGEPSPAEAAIGVYAYLAAVRAERRRLAESIATRLEAVPLPAVCRGRFRVAHTIWNTPLRSYPENIAVTGEVASELRRTGLPRAEAQIRLALARHLALIGLVREAAERQRTAAPLLASLEPDVPAELVATTAQIDCLIHWGTPQGVVAEERALARIVAVAGTDSAWAVMNFADALWEGGCPDRAEQVLVPLLAEHVPLTSRMRALALWSTMLAFRGRGREALALADEAVAYGRRHPLWGLALGLCLRRIEVSFELGDLDGVERDLGWLVARAPSPTPPRVEVEVDFVRARLAAARGSGSAAPMLEALATRARDLGLLWWLPLECLAQTLALRRDWTGALETLDRLPDPSRVRALRLRLEALRGLGRHDDAVRLLGTLSPARDGFGWVSTALAAARAEAGHPSVPLGKPDDREPWSRVWLARIALAQGEVSRAALLLDGATHTTRPPLLVQAIDELRDRR